MATRSKKDQDSKSKKAQAELEAILEEAEFLDKKTAEEVAANPKQPGRFNVQPELELGARIQTAREDKRLTQGELADLTKGLDPEEKGVSRAVISLYEAGTNRPSPREIRLLCEALRVTPNFLIYGDEQPFHPLNDEKRSGGRTRSDPEGFAWMAHVFGTLHHNHFAALMSLALDLQRGWNKKFDHGMQEEANKHFLEMADKLRERLRKRESLK
ncbi:MAG: helix-turn-helix transcriptional regulator [Aquabacterium sp.]|uniref:helix-turn-helix domain-containing protein n=1 Tax=Aquabacterium sp. TaxID=1872578 RepID=UPI0025C01BD2|nr:helix-turn-helix transcriptional regulator [Aquabacterium sp.]MBI5926329.1 helix-turn-helix transcriptional regulator [Aquabacterium sp.]